jgi:peptidase E
MVAREFPEYHRVMKRIVALGGGGFMMESSPSLLDDYLISSTQAKRPRVCFIPTASGDAEDDLANFYRAFGRFDAELSHLAFFRKPRPGAIALGEFEQRLVEQNLIYVGGGNTKSMLAVWRDWGVPQALRTAMTHGAVLAGVSAGAICWFEWGASDSLAPGSRSSALRCLGFLRGSCSPHWGNEAHRRRDFHALVRSGQLPGGYGISDGAALTFDDGRMTEAVITHNGAGAVHVSLAGDRLQEAALDCRLLARPSAPARPRTTR